MQGPSAWYSRVMAMVTCHVVAAAVAADVVVAIVFRGVRNPMKMSDIGFLKTELTSKTENLVSAVRFSKNQLQQFGDGFSRCLIHNSSSNMMGSTVRVFFSYRISALLVLSHFR